MISDERIMGFVEGEGCFCIAISKYVDRKPRKGTKRAYWKNPAIGFKVKPNFKVGVVEEDNAILYAIKERFGFGEVYTQKRTGNLKNCSYYCVQKTEDLQKLIDFFKSQQFYLSKGKSFQYWAECIELFKNKQHRTKEGFLRICELREKMNSKLGGKNVRKLEDIKKILELKPEHIEVHLSKNEPQILHNLNVPGSKEWYQNRKGNHLPST
ncbi:MAG: LAGLIDADG family homing endonuclease [Candidatus Diapherotrites archaeon]|nr:LAGLIDADG family homing endonuclease [Candidatus Diapherotrites archaeon]